MAQAGLNVKKTGCRKSRWAVPLSPGNERLQRLLLFVCAAPYKTNQYPNMSFLLIQKRLKNLTFSFWP